MISYLVSFSDNLNSQSSQYFAISDGQCGFLLVSISTRYYRFCKFEHLHKEDDLQFYNSQIKEYIF